MNNFFYLLSWLMNKCGGLKARRSKSLKRLAKGAALWNALEEKLPVAYGVLEDDIPRMAAFKALLPSFSAKKKRCLKDWLEDRLYDLNHNFCEHFTMSDEVREQKYRQIYSQHLEALNA